MQKSGVTLKPAVGRILRAVLSRTESCPHKSTQFNKYYADYVHKAKPPATGTQAPVKLCQWTGPGQTAALVDTDTGNGWTPTCLCVAAFWQLRLHKAFLDMKQGWITSLSSIPVFGGLPASLTPDNLKTGVVRTPDEACSTKPPPGDGGALRHRYSSGPSPQSQGQGLCGGAPWASPPPGSWQLCVTASSCPSTELNQGHPEKAGGL